jgi:hypothetical protein
MVMNKRSDFLFGNFGFTLDSCESCAKIETEVRETKTPGGDRKMKKAEIETGKRYMAKVNGRLVPVLVTGIEADYKGRMHYSVTSEVTGRQTSFRSAVKFDCPLANGFIHAE